MFSPPEVLKRRAEIYCRRLGLHIVEQRLGRGLQGMVFLSSNQSAIKVHADFASYTREIQAYSRLAQHNVAQVRLVSVPSLKAFDDKLFIIEMSVVRPPFIVDFGGAYLDEPAPHAQDPYVRERWLLERKENFGENFAVVNAILADLETIYGIYLTDVHPGNIRLVCA